MTGFTTQRLILEPLNRNHADAFYEGLKDGRLYEYIDESPPSSLAALRQRYTKLESRLKETRAYAGYVQATILRNSIAMIAYVLFAESWGNGYAREATGAMLEQLKRVHGVTVATAAVDRRNERSRQLLRFMGFVEAKCHAQIAGDVQFEKIL